MGNKNNGFISKKLKGKKRRAGRPLPKWLVPVVSLVLIVAVVAGIAVAVMANNGTFKRNNILMKSKSGKYDLDQQTANIILWTTVYDSIYNNFGSASDSDSVFSYCFGTAQQMARYERKTYLKEYEDVFAQYLALCDYGVEHNIAFTKAEQDAAMDSMVYSLRSKAYAFYSYYATSWGISSPYTYAFSSDSPYFGYFLKEIFGDDISEKDIRRAAVLLTYADKVSKMQSDLYWNQVEAEDLLTELTQTNPESYYKTGYLTYETDDATFADKLAKATTEAEFKDLIVADYVEKNYKNPYNLYVGAAGKLKTKIESAEIGNARNAVIAEAEMTLVETTKDESTLVGEVKDWVFSTSRTTNEVTVIPNGNLQTVVVIKATKDEETNKVSALVKDFETETLDAEGLEKLTNSVRKKLGLKVAEDAPVYEETEEYIYSVVTQLTNDGIELPTEKTAEYQKPAAVKAQEMLDKLKAEEDPAHYMEHQSATMKENVTAENTQNMPDEQLHAAVIAEGVAAGDKFLVDAKDSTAKYLVYIQAKDENGVTVSYVKVSTYEEGTLEAWLFGDVEIAADGTTTGSPAKGTTKIMPHVETDSIDYHVYLIVSDPMKLDSETIYRGGYVEYTNQKDAEKALKKLEGLTGSALWNEFSKLTANSEIAAMEADDIESTELKDWFDSDERKSDESAIITVESGDGTTVYYVAVFQAKLEAYKNDVRENLASGQLSEYLEQVMDEYTVSEKALAKVKNDPDPSKTETEPETNTDTEPETDTETEPESGTDTEPAGED